MAVDEYKGERNENGHIVITINGLNLTGSEEIARLEEGGHHLSDWVKSAFWSTGAGSYDSDHRLLEKTYRLALVSGYEIEKDSERTNENMWKLGIGYGYKRPPAGVIPRLRETVSDEEMLSMGFEYIIPAHPRLIDSQGGPIFVSIVSYFGGNVVFGNWGMPHVHWWGQGAWAFLVP